MPRPATLAIGFSLVIGGFALSLWLSRHVVSVQNRSEERLHISCEHWLREQVIDPKSSKNFPYAVFGFSTSCLIKVGSRGSRCALSLRPLADLYVSVGERGEVDCYVPE